MADDKWVYVCEVMVVVTDGRTLGGKLYQDSETKELKVVTGEE